MKVAVEDFNIAMDLGNNGVTFSVRDNDGGFRGKLRVGKGAVEWCRGKVPIGSGVTVKWEDFIKFFEKE